MRALAHLAKLLPFLTLATTLNAAGPGFPLDYRELTAPIPMTTVEAFLKEADGAGNVSVSEVGRSVSGRPIHLVHVQSRATKPATWKVLLIGAQHGNEPAGATALLYMIRDLMDRSAKLNATVDLWIIPVANPDGYAVNKRTNANDMDLNRDHIGLTQPETQTIHRVHRQLMPLVTVDCHEFARDSGDYVDAGWTEWPIIMMDAGSNPLFDPAIRKAGLEWVSGAEKPLAARGHNYMRYNVGGLPPEEELRWSTLVTDDARNGLAMDGGLAFIIESGMYRGAKNPSADLGTRVDAYLALLDPFLKNTKRFGADAKRVQASRAAKAPAWLPTNYFWGSNDLRLTDVSVIDRKTSDTLILKTPNFMQDLIVKSAVPTPKGYAIDAALADKFTPLFEAHGIAFEKIGSARKLTVERVKVLRREDGTDPVYNRFGGRIITQRQKAVVVELPAGSLMVAMDQPAWRRAALVLEPTMLYGLHSEAPWDAMAKADDVLPVHRVIE